MPATYIERDTVSDLGSTGGDAETTEFIKVLNQATAASVSVSYTIAKNATERLKWVTEVNNPNKLDWDGGTYTWEFEVLTANSNLSIVEVILRRLSSDGATVRASKSSGAISVGLGTTGVKTETIAWNDGSQNPAGRQASDRLEVVFRIQNSTMAAQSGAVGTNTVNNELATPLLLLSVVGRSITKLYDIFAQVGRSHIHLYDLIQIAGKSIIKLYDLRQLASKAQTHLYDILVVQVRHGIAQDIDDIIQFVRAQRKIRVIATLRCLYNVKKSVRRSNKHRYNIRQLALKTNNHIYSNRIKIGRSIGKIYDIRAISKSEVTCIYGINRTVGRTLTCKHDIDDPDIPEIMQVIEIVQRIARSKDQ